MSLLRRCRVFAKAQYFESTMSTYTATCPSGHRRVFDHDDATGRLEAHDIVLLECPSCEKEKATT